MQRAGAGNSIEGGNTVQGEIANVTFIGDLVQYSVRIGGDEIMIEEATRREATRFAVGDTVSLAWSSGDTLVYPDKDQ